VKCAGCGKEIPPAQQRFYDLVDGDKIVKIPEPCDECIEKKKEESREIEREHRKQHSQKPKPREK
jgi:hypothetical protein